MIAKFTTHNEAAVIFVLKSMHFKLFLFRDAIAIDRFFVPYRRGFQLTRWLRWWQHTGGPSTRIFQCFRRARPIQGIGFQRCVFWVLEKTGFEVRLRVGYHTKCLLMKLIRRPLQQQLVYVLCQCTGLVGLQSLTEQVHQGGMDFFLGLFFSGQIFQRSTFWCNKSLHFRGRSHRCELLRTSRVGFSVVDCCEKLDKGF